MTASSCKTFGTPVPKVLVGISYRAAAAASSSSSSSSYSPSPCPSPPSSRVRFIDEGPLNFLRENGEEENSNQEDRQHDGEAGDFLQEEKRAFQEGSRALNPL
ncbi:hypothetical protein L1049_014808 [Liquidambar formosana]|uniref:Uncharacterized protein n=1 Tax=Liquidambar formosana TaxID=63359 RepID=A0AAP0S2U3_LIQFO